MQGRERLQALPDGQHDQPVTGGEQGGQIALSARSAKSGSTRNPQGGHASVPALLGVFDTDNVLPARAARTRIADSASLGVPFSAEDNDAGVATGRVAADIPEPAVQGDQDPSGMLLLAEAARVTGLGEGLSGALAR